MVFDKFPVKCRKTLIPANGTETQEIPKEGFNEQSRKTLIPANGTETLVRHLEIWNELSQNPNPG